VAPEILFPNPGEGVTISHGTYSSEDLSGLSAAKNALLKNPFFSPESKLILLKKSQATC